MNFLYEQYHNVDVAWEKALHGGGLKSGRQFISVVKELFGKVERLHEICAGPGFIGFSLFAEGLCNSLSLSDVNPEAIAAQAETIRRNSLEDKVSSYLSVGLDSIPEWEKWDLVVSNPPHFGEPAGEGIISDDPGWRFHESFFKNVHRFLKPHGSVLIQENYIGSEESTFLNYIDEGGLEVVGSYMNIINIRNTVNPYFYLWLRKKYKELIVREIAPSLIKIELDPDGYTNTPIKLEQHKKYRFEFCNKTGKELRISLFDENNMNLFRLKPLAVIVPGGRKESGIFYLTEGRFKVQDIDGKGVFGLLNVEACLQ